MDYLTKLYLKLRYCDRGASMVEYTILVGLITVAVVTTIGLIGTWVGGRWDLLRTAVGA